MSSSPDPNFNIHFTESDPYQWYRLSVCIGSVSIRRIYQQLLRVGRILKQNLKKSNNLPGIFINFRQSSNFFTDNNNSFAKKDVPFASVDSFEALHSLMETKENGIFIDGNGWIHIIMFQGDRRKGGTWTDAQVS